MRSRWKLPVISYNPPLLGPDNKIPSPKTLVADNGILNTRVQLYNGKTYTSIIARDYMIGKRLDQFVSTKYTGKQIHIKRKKRKKNKR